MQAAKLTLKNNEGKTITVAIGDRSLLRRVTPEVAATFATRPGRGDGQPGRPNDRGERRERRERQPVKTAKRVVAVKDGPGEVAAVFRKCWRDCRLFLSAI